MQQQEQAPSPQIKFRVSENEIPESPRLSAIVLKQMVRQLGLEQIVVDLEMGKHHGVTIQDIILVLLLYSAYGSDR